MFQALFRGKGEPGGEAVALSTESSALGPFPTLRPLETPVAQLLYNQLGSQLPEPSPSQCLWLRLGLPPGLQVSSVNPTFISK